MAERVDGLMPEHLAYFTARAVDADVVAERRVFTYQTKRSVQDLGFGERTPAPGFAMPIHDVLGGLAEGYQVRPDKPRTNAKSRLLKFEVPHHFKLRLDVHPRAFPRLADRDVPLFVTEGIPKGDALVSAGYTAVVVLGVWNFTGDALADFEYLRLKGRTVYVVFDSDVMVKPAVQLALVRLGAVLTRWGATVGYVYLPDGPQGRKQGIDDYLAAGGTVADLLAHHTSTEARPTHTAPSDPQETVQPCNRVPVAPPVLASDLRILTRFRRAVAVAGVMGEENIAATLFLVVVSRLLDRLASAVVKGHSASGKSFTVETVLAFFPDSAYITLTGMSQMALVYSPRDYRHRTLVLYEVSALREDVEDDRTAYFLRSLLSENRLAWEVAVKAKDGSFTTQEVVKEGPTNVVLTTTRTSVHAENETRLLSMTTDDSADQTKRVLGMLARENEVGPDLAEWHQLQYWLEGAEHRVTIPYAKDLADKIQPIAVRLRRDFGTLLVLIRAHAVLHQLNRGRDAEGRVVASIEDYTVVRELVGPLIAAGVEATVPEVVRTTVEAVCKLTVDGQADTGVTGSTVAFHLDLDKSATSRRLHRARDGGWLCNLEDRPGRPGRWVPGDPLPDDVALLPEPKELEPQDDGFTTTAHGRATAGNDEPAGHDARGESGCTVARFPGGQYAQGTRHEQANGDSDEWSRWSSS